MISLKKDFKHGVVSLRVTQPDDLWYLSHIIAIDDTMRMKTERKIKLNDGTDTNTKVVRKTVVLTLQIEHIQLSDDSAQLRVKGKVLSGPEDVPHGSYHTFGVSVNDEFVLTKNSWPTYLKEKLIEAEKNNAQAVLIVVYDRDVAQFSLVRQTGIEQLAELKSDSQKKQYETKGEDIFSLLAKQIQEYVAQYSPAGIVAASPHFWKDNLQKILPDALKKKTVFLATSTVNRSVVGKLLTRPELASLMASQRLQVEQKFTDLLLAKLNNDEVAYGLDDVNESAVAGAISDLGVTQHFLSKAKSDGFYDKLDRVLQAVDKAQGKIYFLYEEETAKVVDGLGGVAGVLRWKMN